MKQPIICLIVAVAKNRIIGRDGDMPWRLSSDLKRFKALTLGCPVIMGRKTFESIGKALPGRTNIVVTRNSLWTYENVTSVPTINEALALARKSPGGDAKIVVIGGGEIYQQSMELADFLHVTHVDASPDGDTQFPEIDPLIWKEIHSEFVPRGEKDSAETRYVIYQRFEDST